MSDEPHFEAVAPEKRKRGRPAKDAKPLRIGAPADVAAKNLVLLAEETAKLIIAGRDLPKERTRLAELSDTQKTALIALFGEDFNKAREFLAIKYMLIADKIANRIEKEIPDLPHSSLGFTMSVLNDKAENLMTKAATSSRGAAVGTTINFFGDGTFSREEIMRRLAGNLNGPDDKPEPIPVQAQESA